MAQISEIRVEELSASDLRIDAEYYKPIYLRGIDQLGRINSSSLYEIASIKGGKRLPKGESFSNEGIPYIRAEDIKNGFVNYKTSPKISDYLHKLLKNYQTKKGDVILTIVGNSIGDVGIVKFDLDKCNLTENCIRAISKKGQLLSEFLFTFLISHYGQIQIEREKVGSAQPKLAIVRIRDFQIPIFPLPQQEKIANIVDSLHNNQNMVR